MRTIESGLSPDRRTNLNHSLYAVILLSYRIQIYISRFDFLLDPFCIFILLYMFCLDYCT